MGDSPCCVRFTQYGPQLVTVSLMTTSIAGDDGMSAYEAALRMSAALPELAKSVSVSLPLPTEPASSLSVATGSGIGELDEAPPPLGSAGTNTIAARAPPNAEELTSTRAHQARANCMSPQKVKRNGVTTRTNSAAA